MDQRRPHRDHRGTTTGSPSAHPTRRPLQAKRGHDSPSRGRLESYTNDARLVRVQALVRRWLARRRFRSILRAYAASKESGQARRRLQIVKEIYATELSYVEQLKVATIVFLEPLQAMAKQSKTPPLKEDEIRLIFSNIKDIGTLHMQVRRDLDREISEMSWNVGKVFLQLAPFMKVYTTYINNYNKAQVALCKLTKKRKAFRIFLAERERTSQSPLDLASLLITPIQRIPRYKLLLEDLIKNTPETHVDCKELKGADEKISEIAAFLNESAREFEQMEKVIDIERKLYGDFATLIEPHRKFVREGAVKIVGRREDREILRDRQLVLFNDVLVIAKRTARGLKFKRRLDMAGMTVFMEEDTGGTQRCFCLKLPSNELVKVLAPTEAEKGSWFTAADDVVATLAVKEQLMGIAAIQKMIDKGEIDEGVLRDFRRERKSKEPVVEATFVLAIVEQMKDPVMGLVIKDRKHHLKTYHRTFLGSEAVGWMKTHLHLDSRHQAINLGNALLRSRIICQAPREKDAPFQDGPMLYRFVECVDNARPAIFRRTMRESVSLVEENDFACSLEKDPLPVNGHLYVQETEIYFVAKMFGLKTRDSIPTTKISKCLRIADRTIHVLVSKGDDFKFRFMSQTYRERAYEAITGYWKKVKGAELHEGLVSGQHKHTPDILAMTRDDWALVMKGVQSRTFHEGDVVVQKGECIESLLEIARGSVRVEKEGDTQVLGVMSTFGESTFVESRPLEETITADESHVDLYIIPGTHVRSLFKDHTGLEGRFFRFLCVNTAQKLQKTNRNKVLTYHKDMSDGEKVKFLGDVLKAASHANLANLLPTKDKATPKPKPTPKSGPSQESAPSSSDVHKKKFQDIFLTDSDDTILEEYPCSVKEHIAQHGTLYIAKSFVGFHAAVFGASTKLVVPYVKIKNLCTSAEQEIHVMVEGGTWIFYNFRDMSRVFAILESTMTTAVRRMSRSFQSASDSAENMLETDPSSFHSTLTHKTPSSEGHRPASAGKPRPRTMSSDGQAKPKPRPKSMMKDGAPKPATPVRRGRATTVPDPPKGSNAPTTAVKFTKAPTVNTLGPGQRVLALHSSSGPTVRSSIRASSFPSSTVHSQTASVPPSPPHRHSGAAKTKPVPPVSSPAGIPKDQRLRLPSVVGRRKSTYEELRLEEEQSQQSWVKILGGDDKVPVVFEPNATIVREGDTQTAVFQVAWGSVLVEGDTENGERAILARLERGEIFGEMAFLGEGRHTTRITAEKEGVGLYTIDVGLMMTLFAREPSLCAEFFRYLLKVLVKRLRDSSS